MNLRPRANEHVLTAPFVPHGAIGPAELAALGLTADEVVDFSVNGNAFGPAPGVAEAIAQAALTTYPDPQVIALRQAVSDLHGVSPEQILAGNGSMELMWLLALAFLQKRDRVLVVGPTFGEYARSAQVVGAVVKMAVAREADGFSAPIAAVSGALSATHYRVVYLCNPNNPTGSLVPQSVIARWARQAPQTLFVVDEAYLDFVVDGQSSIALGLPNILVLRSMTKAHALAGLRLGYVVGPTEIIDALARVQTPWSVNAMAQAAGVAALRDGEHFAQTLVQIRDDKDVLVRALVALGFAPVPSWTHYFLMDVGDGKVFRDRLLRRGIVVRDCASFGLPRYVRIAGRTEVENGRLVAALTADAGSGLHG